MSVQYRKSTWASVFRVISGGQSILCSLVCRSSKIYTAKEIPLTMSYILVY